MLMNTPEYLSIIENIKSEIKAAQYRATIHANSDLLLLYYDIGRMIAEITNCAFITPNIKNGISK